MPAAELCGPGTHVASPARGRSQSPSRCCTCCPRLQTWTTRPMCSCMHVSQRLPLVKSHRLPDATVLAPGKPHHAAAQPWVAAGVISPCPRMRPHCPTPGGETLQEAFENVGLCMFNYMTPLKGIGIDPALTRCAACRCRRNVLCRNSVCAPALAPAQQHWFKPPSCSVQRPCSRVQVTSSQGDPPPSSPQDVRGGGARPAVAAVQLPGRAAVCLCHRVLCGQAAAHHHL